MTQHLYYRLEGHTPVPCTLEETEGVWANDERIVEKTSVGDIEISTVFMPLNHAFDDGPPLVFETMIFGGDLDGEMWRYSTWDEAAAGHAKAVNAAKRGST